VQDPQVAAQVTQQYAAENPQEAQQATDRGLGSLLGSAMGGNSHSSSGMGMAGAAGAGGLGGLLLGALMSVSSGDRMGRVGRHKRRRDVTVACGALAQWPPSPVSLHALTAEQEQAQDVVRLRRQLRPQHGPPAVHGRWRDGLRHGWWHGRRTVWHGGDGRNGHDGPASRSPAWPPPRWRRLRWWLWRAGLRWARRPPPRRRLRWWARRLWRRSRRRRRPWALVDKRQDRI
jgi:hypothetical protein